MEEPRQGTRERAREGQKNRERKPPRKQVRQQLKQRFIVTKRLPNCERPAYEGPEPKR